MVQRRDTTELLYICLKYIIENESDPSMTKTKLQFLVNTSYDKLKNYLQTLESKEFIVMGENDIKSTHKGREFFSEYAIVSKLKEDIENKFL